MRTAREATTRHIRGSSLLFAGRALSLALNFATQVLIVRSLSKSDFGAFAYALSLATMVSTATTLGLDRALSRFVPIFDEHDDRDSVAGTLLVVFGTVLSLGIAAIVAAAGLQGVIGHSLGGEGTATAVILILIVLGPLEALDGLVVGMFAVFAKPRAIFIRRYVLAPGLRLAVVGILIAGDGGVRFLAAGYVAAGAVGILVYGAVLIKILRARGIMVGWRRAHAAAPVRTIFAFALPLLTTDLLFIVMRVTDTALLGHFGGPTDVASYRAVFPVARMNEMVLLSFVLLFAPMAARLFARSDVAGLGRMYRETTAWLVALSFPIFATTAVLADDVTRLLFGARYADSSTYLILLSGGFFASVVAGFNGVTLRAMGEVRWIVAVDALVIPLNLVLGFLLIPTYGALGASIATLATLVVHNIGKQVALRRAAGIAMLDLRTARVFGAVAIAGGALVALEWLLDLGLFAGLSTIALASVLVLRASRRALRITETFPEIAKLPIIGPIVGGRR